MRTKRWVVPGMLVAVVALAAGCTGDDPAEGNQTVGPQVSLPPSAPVPNLADPCSLLTGDAVGAAAGLGQVQGAAGPGQATAKGGQVKTCVYRSGQTDAAALSITTFTGTGQTVPQVLVAQKSGRAQARDVPGVGEGAVFYLDQGSSATLAAAKAFNGAPALVNLTMPPTVSQDAMAGLVKQAIDGIR